MANQWYYAQNGQQFGPAPGEQLRNMLSSGALRPSDGSIYALTPASGPGMPGCRIVAARSAPARPPRAARGRPMAGWWGTRDLSLPFGAVSRHGAGAGIVSGGR